jgi:hypothetical protein
MIKRHGQSAGPLLSTSPMQPRVLVGSHYNDGMTLYNASVFEFCQIIAEASGGDTAAPLEIQGSVAKSFASAVSKARRAVGKTRHSLLSPIDVTDQYDLFFYVCMQPRNLADLKAIRGWREKSRKAAVFILEAWSSQLARDKAHLAVLNEFDHVFLFNQASIPNVQAYTSTPCSFLPAGADCLTAVPDPVDAPRPIDVYSMGRRSEAAHRQLHEMARNSEIFYLYDAGGGMRVHDFAQARFLTLNYIKRSRFFVAHRHAVGAKALEAAGEEAIPSRMFEGAAGGAVMIGSAPQCPEFNQLFDWPDAVIEIPPDPVDMRGILANLTENPDRIMRASISNVTQSLRRHDWIYRWEQVLNSLGFEVSPAVRARKARLESLARKAEEAFQIA